MAITLSSKINGQPISGSLPTYCYLYEPYLIGISESDLTAEKIYIDLVIRKIELGTIDETLIKYAEFDINPGVDVDVDIMKIAGAMPGLLINLIHRIMFHILVASEDFVCPFSS